MIKECVNLAFHAWFVVEGIVIKVAKLKDILFQVRALKRCGNDGLDKSRFFEGHQALKTLDKEHYISLINIFAHSHYLTLFMRLIKMRVKVTKICLIPSFGALQWKVRRWEEFAGRVWIGGGNGGAGFLKESDSLKNRFFSIILHKANIFFLFLFCKDIIAAATAEEIALKIVYCITGFIAGWDMSEISFWNRNIASE